MSETSSNLSGDEPEDINGTYIGEYVGDRSSDGKRDGIGRAILPNRDQYEGDYRKGLRDGHGVYHFKSGARYDGEWKKGLKHGRGKFTYPDGSSYCGEWKMDMKHGFGKYFYENGDAYEGAWVNDVKHGVGTYKYKEAEITVRGTWLSGSLKGPIEIIYSNFRYHGYWKNFQPVGDGVFTFSSKISLPGHIDFFPNPNFPGNFDLNISKNGSVNFSENSRDVPHTSSKIPRDSNATKIPDDLQKSKESATLRNSSDIPRCLPEFVPHRIEPYNYSKLPQHPFPLPTTDSLSTICTKSSKSDLELYNTFSPILITADPIDDAGKTHGK